ncbi:MAG: pilus assembly protein PilP [Legionellales bacterium]
MIKIRILVIGSLCLFLGACSGDNSDLANYIEHIKHRPVVPIEPLPQFAPLPVFIYPEHDNRRNPFKPVDLKIMKDEFAPDQKRKKQALELFPLDALKFVGVLEQGTVIWALIKQPDGKIDRIGVGNYMGQNYGRVILIKNDLMKLEETTKDSGKWTKHITVLNLNVGKLGT